MFAPEAELLALVKSAKVTDALLGSSTTCWIRPNASFVICNHLDAWSKRVTTLP